MDYPQRLQTIKLSLLDPYTGAKKHHRMQCMLCEYEFTATPLSKLQNHKKSNLDGCPRCTAQSRYAGIREQNTQKLIANGLEILSDWDGQRVVGVGSIPIPVTVRNAKCGHTFTSSSVNLLNKSITCSVCGILNRTGNINHWSELNSAKWRQTAPAWKVYRAEVTKLTRLTYRKHHATINPNNLPTGRAGTEGAYHLDHIVPVRWCFVRNVPPEIVADVTNLEMIPWRENIVHRDNLKGDMPLLFQPYVDVEVSNTIADNIHTGV